MELGFGLGLEEEVEALAAADLDAVGFGRLHVVCVCGYDTEVCVVLEADVDQVKGHAANHSHTIRFSRLDFDDFGTTAC